MMVQRLSCGSTSSGEKILKETGNLQGIFGVRIEGALAEVVYRSRVLETKLNVVPSRGPHYFFSLAAYCHLHFKQWSTKG